MITPTSFRSVFSEFSDSSKYSDAQINYWLTLSASFINPCVWLDDSMRDFGTQLFIAHYLSIAVKNQIASTAGGVPGTANSGIATTKTVDKVSVGYDVAMIAFAAGGQWNLTTYGMQFYQLALIVGMGGIQLMPEAPYPNLNNVFNPYVN